MARAFVAASSEVIYKANSVLTTYPVTLSCWYYVTGTPDYSTLIGLANSAGTDPGAADTDFFAVALQPNLGSGQVVFQVFDQDTATYDEVTPTAGTWGSGVWEHVCGVGASSTSRSIYFNGGAKNTRTGAVSVADINRFSIGALQSGITIGPWDGYIAEVGVWNVALTDDEVVALAAGASPLFFRPENLIFYVPLVRDIIDFKHSGAFTTTGTSAIEHPRVYTPFAPSFLTTLSPAVAATLPHHLLLLGVGR